MRPIYHLERDIRTAHFDEAGAIAEVIAAAFEPLDMTRWLVSDQADRIPIMTGFLHLTVEHAIAHGTVDVIGDLLAVAVWLPFPTPDIDDYDQRLKDACGSYTERFQALDVAMHHSHPTDRPHEYLPFIAVRRDIQTCGLGSALLDHHHAMLDLRGIPAYLEAASPNSARLYRRHGYRPIREPFGPAGSDARLYPMWREPGGPSTSGCGPPSTTGLGNPAPASPSSLDLGVVDAVSGSRDALRGNSAALSGCSSESSRTTARSDRRAQSGGDGPGSGVRSGVGRVGSG